MPEVVSMGRRVARDLERSLPCSAPPVFLATYANTDRDWVEIRICRLRRWGFAGAPCCWQCSPRVPMRAYLWPYPWRCWRPIFGGEVAHFLSLSSILEHALNSAKR